MRSALIPEEEEEEDKVAKNIVSYMKDAHAMKCGDAAVICGRK